MEIISSKNNSIIKKFRSLSVKKYREQFGMYILEGEKVVKEALKLKKQIAFLCIKSSKQNNFSNIIDIMSDKTLILDDEVFCSISSTVSPQSILAVVNYEPIIIVKHKFDRFIVLDHLQDPGNMGTIIRSGIASGFTDFVLINCVDPFSEKAIRSSSGAILYANIFNLDEKQFENFINCNNIDIVVAEANKNSIFNPNTKLPRSFALVIGNEGNGISNFIKSFKHYSVSIPMDKKIESLNAGVSASVLMFVINNICK